MTDVPLSLPHGTADLRITLPSNRVFVAGREAPGPARSWQVLTTQALDTPLQAAPLERTALSGKKVCVITDDWARPTPAHLVLPEIVGRLLRAGLRRDDLCFVTASGMHDPMDDDGLRRKLGDAICDAYPCFAHDAGDRENLSFVGITGMGTPLWVNRRVAEADFRIAVGRVYPHVAYGYEGGYKIIVPGVASFETIMRDHSMNFSELSTYGAIHGNPSRTEAEACGRLLGLDFVINFVVDRDGNPAAAFAGSCDAAFRAAVDYGERTAWGINVLRRHDITVIAGGGVEHHGLGDNPAYYLSLAAAVTKDDGCVVAVVSDRIAEHQPPVVAGVNLGDLSLGELLRLHEKRTWNCGEREQQRHVKNIRGEFYFRRVTEMRTQKVFLVCGEISAKALAQYRARHFTDVNDAFQQACAACPDPSVLVIPDITRTYPLVQYSFPRPGDPDPAETRA